MSKFQTKFKSSYDEEKKILLNGKNNSQEVSLKDNSQSSDLEISLFKEEKELYGNKEVQRLVDHFARLLCQEEEDGAVKELQESKSFLATQGALKPSDVYPCLHVTKMTKIMFLS